MTNLRPLFSLNSKDKEPEIINNIEETKTLAIEAESSQCGWISRYVPSEHTDRFQLISPEDTKYACKFYNKDTDDFVGASLMAMYMLRDHFDRSIIPVDENL